MPARVVVALLLLSCMTGPPLTPLQPCDIALSGQLAADDDSHTGFSANDLLVAIDGLSGPVEWDGIAVGYGSVERLTLSFDSPTEPVCATVRTPAEESWGHCRGIDGEALAFSALAEVENADGSLHARGQVEITASSTADLSRVSVLSSDKAIAADAIPAEVVGVAELQAEDPGSTEDWALFLILEGELDRPTVELSVRVQRDDADAVGTIGTATVTPD